MASGSGGLNAFVAEGLTSRLMHETATEALFRMRLSPEDQLT
jgi:hypothetical protein